MLSGLMLVLAACGSAEPAVPSGTEPIVSTTAGRQPDTTVRPATETDVMFPGPGTTLEGTLRLPELSGAAPGVVLIHGSGPVSRDARISGQLGMAFGFEVPVFEDLAEGLRAHGFAVLVYDKRSCGPFNGCADNAYALPSDDITVDTFMADAAAAVEWLRTQPEVDPDNVSIIGHSQGAQFVVPMLVADPALEHGVMIAGPFRPIDEIIEAQRDFVVDLLVELGTPLDQAQASPSVTPMSDLVEGLAAIRSGGQETVGGVSAEFWMSWFEVTDRTRSVASEVSQSILVLNGDLDWNVPATEAEAWRTFLEEAAVDAEVVIYPCVTHALNCVDESEIAAITPQDIHRGVAPEIVDEIVRFLEPEIG